MLNGQMSFVRVFTSRKLLKVAFSTLLGRSLCSTVHVKYTIRQVHQNPPFPLDALHNSKTSCPLQLLPTRST